MQIAQTPEMLAITLEDSGIYYHLQNIIDKNFPHRIGRKNKIIIFPKEDETTPRRYFLKLVAKIYKKNSTKRVYKKELESIQSCYEKTIKLSLLQQNQVLPNLRIPVIFENNHAVTFDLGTNNRLFVSYMKNYFVGHLLQYRMRSCALTLFPNSDLTCHRLEKLFAQREHMAWYITFVYNPQSFDEFKATLANRYERKRRFQALSGIMEEYFAALGCTPEDSYAKVRQQYLHLVKIYHPDRHATNNQAVALQYREKFEKIQSAYEMIKAYFQEEKDSFATA